VDDVVGDEYVVDDEYVVGGGEVGGDVVVDDGEQQVELVGLDKVLVVDQSIVHSHQSIHQSMNQ